MDTFGHLLEKLVSGHTGRKDGDGDGNWKRKEKVEFLSPGSKTIKLFLP